MRGKVTPLLDPAQKFIEAIPWLSPFRSIILRLRRFSDEPNVAHVAHGPNAGTLDDLVRDQDGEEEERLFERAHGSAMPSKIDAIPQHGREPTPR